jgi:phenol hydroxylase P1 protein
MQMDLKTVEIKPQRETYAHVAARIGSKPASRYQEGTFDLQSTGNPHYRPLWDPGFDYFDEARTKIAMKDWYEFKDPRQYYYGSYVMARAKQQENAEASFSFVESRNLAHAIPEDVKEDALRLLLPLRHVAWGASMNNDFIAAYGFGTGITQPALYAAMDQLGIAQFITRSALLFADADALDTAKTQWMEADEWQPLRRLAEDLMVEQDWFELFVAQNLVIDGLLFPLVYGTIIDDEISMRGGSAFSMTCQFQVDWAKEAVRWTDAQIKAAVKESDENAALVSEWVGKWKPRAIAALLPVAQIVLEDRAEAALEEVSAEFDRRLGKLGVAA